MTFKKAVPEDRTIVSGLWSDILDDWSDTFVEANNGTSQQVSLTNVSDVVLGFSGSQLSNIDVAMKTLDQLKLLNLRIEEAFETGITLEDI